LAAGWDAAGVSPTKDFSGITGANAMTKRRGLNNDEVGQRKGTKQAQSRRQRQDGSGADISPVVCLLCAYVEDEYLLFFLVQCFGPADPGCAVRK